MLKWGRAIWRLAGMFVMIAGGGLAYVCSARNRRTLRGRAEWLSRTSRRCLRVLHVTIAQPNGPLPHGVFLTPNHVGYLDILVLAALTPVVFVSKHEVGDWPVFGWFAQRCGTRFLRRAERRDLVRVGRELAPVVEAGVNLAVFLEGTSSDGRDVLPFKSSLLAPAVAEGWTVVPVGLTYHTAEGIDPGQKVAWWGDMELVPHLLGFAALPWVEAEVRWAEARPAGSDRKELAAFLHREVAGLVTRRGSARSEVSRSEGLAG